MKQDQGPSLVCECQLPIHGNFYFLLLGKNNSEWRRSRGPPCNPYPRKVDRFMKGLRIGRENARGYQRKWRRPAPWCMLLISLLYNIGNEVREGLVKTKHYNSPLQVVFGSSFCSSISSRQPSIRSRGLSGSSVAR